MIKHYFKIALRNFAKQKSLAFINVFGLSVGLACFTLFLLFAVNEFSFDRFHKERENIYRVYIWSEAKGDEDAKGDTYHPMPLGPSMKENLPDVVNYIRFRERWKESFVKTDNKIIREMVSFADPQIFSAFSFKLKSGDPATALTGLHNLVLTEAAAKKIFGETSPIGKTIDVKIEDKFESFMVSAIAENLPSNSTIQFSMLGNFNYIATTSSGKGRVNNWHQSSYQTYVQLKPGSTLPADKDRMITFRKQYYPDEESNSRKAGWTGKGPRIWYGLQPLQNIHTNIKITGGATASVDPKTIWILLTIAAGLLLIACINFTTLAICRSAGRAKEIGVRKVFGSGKKQLVFQFLAEALLLSILSAAFGLLLGKLLLPYFNRLSGRELSFSFAQYPEMIGMLIGLVLLVGLLTGSYPAVVLSGFKSIEVLKSKIHVAGSNIFTKSLVTIQFILSIGLIISTVIILQQLKFMQSKNPGFNKENIVVVDAEGADTKKIYPLFKQALTGQPAITGVAASDLGLGEGTGWSIRHFQYNGKNKDVYEYFVDADYISLMDIKLIVGRNFDPKIASDTVTSVIINESMLNDFGWTKENAVGQELKGYSENLTPVVIGVVKNFNFRPFSEKVEPQVFHQFHDYAPYKYFVRIKPGNPAPALAVINKTWSGAVPDLPFKYEFLDESLNRFYQSESRWSNIVGWAGGISIFLACLGLFGLAALAAVNRTKEIGIRKVLGASVTGIVGLLSKDFVKLVLIALIIASPVAWYTMNKWLQDFAYPIDISWWIFILAGIIAVCVALFTISFQAIKAAIANPVKSLRTE